MAVLSTYSVIASAQAEAPKRDPLTLGGQANFALGVQAGFYQATGAALQLGTSDVALGVSGGFVPVFYNEGPSAKIAVLPSFQGDSDLLVRLWTIQGTTPLGLRAGYRFNSVLGHGFGVGGYAERRLTKVVALSASYGLTFFPQAIDRLEEEGHNPRSIGGMIGGGLSVGILFYP